MSRTTAGLFVPLFEVVVLSAICYPAMHSFFSTIPLDYSPSTRSAMLCSLVLSLVTGFLQLLLSAAEKTLYVGAQQKKLPLLGIGNPRHAMDIANAYCCAAALLLFLYLALFLQCSAFSEQLDASLSLQRKEGALSSSQRADWVYACIGASAGWIFSPTDRQTRIPVQPVTTPFMGSIFCGMAMGYMGTMFLLSLYISYMATPESASSFLFLEPRFLVIASGFLGFGVGPAIAGSYAGCTDPAGAIVGFSCFAVAACFFDLIFVAMQGGGERLHMYGKWIGLQAMAVTPLFFFLAGNVPTTIKVCCSILVVAASISNAVDLVFHGWSGEDGAAAAAASAAAPVAGAAAAAASALQWHMGEVAAAATATAAAAAAAAPLHPQQQQQQQPMMMTMGIPGSYNNAQLDYYSRKRN